MPSVETGTLKEEPVDDYPTSLASRATAENVNSFYEGQSFRTSILQGFESASVMAADFEEDTLPTVDKSDSVVGNKYHSICSGSQALLCCWGRDRQSNDDNGNCKASDCDDAEPADNTNLYVRRLEAPL